MLALLEIVSLRFPSGREVEESLFGFTASEITKRKSVFESLEEPKCPIKSKKPAVTSAKTKA
jgi:hypothetical protein